LYIGKLHSSNTLLSPYFSKWHNYFMTTGENQNEIIMKKSLIFVAVASALVIASCNSSTSTTTTGNDTTAANGTTTTTVTTTTRTYSGTFQPQPNVKYIDLKTHKEVVVRIDTVRGSVVNAETNEPIYLFVAPGSTDTFYGGTGNIANGHITEDASGNYNVDASLSSDNSSTDASTTTTATDNSSGTTDESQSDIKKYKSNGNKEKLKTSDEKIKEKGDKEKIKAK